MRLEFESTLLPSCGEMWSVSLSSLMLTCSSYASFHHFSASNSLSLAYWHSSTLRFDIFYRHFIYFYELPDIYFVVFLFNSEPQTILK